jgi:hypothetical protein
MKHSGLTRHEVLEKIKKVDYNKNYKKNKNLRK